MIYLLLLTSLNLNGIKSLLSDSTIWSSVLLPYGTKLTLSSAKPLIFFNFVPFLNPKFSGKCLSLNPPCGSTPCCPIAITCSVFSISPKVDYHSQNL